MRLAVDDIIKAEYPDPPEHIEHSRKIVAIAALLMPEPLPMLGELGEWPFASGLDLPEKPTGDWLTDAIVADATAASKGPHGYRPTVLDLRKVGREELLFERMPGEARKVEQCLPLDDLLKLLRVAVDELIKLPKADASLQTPPMLATADGPRHFDVFLCHNNKDKPAVKKIGNQLRSRGISPWLDEWELLPGVPWQRRLEEQIQSIAAAAVFVGSSGMGPWQQREVDALLLEFVNRGCPVIPVILSDCHTEPALPLFLRAHTWVDFRKADPDPMAQLIWGITQKKESNQPAR
ncbi:MAG: toll/interleukin-1 receptor domain-containing protein [Planctomycetota bacterium]|nr:toll/interleukin-1 receptor domain-containing protein [Planctomycetota bacterium]